MDIDCRLCLFSMYSYFDDQRAMSLSLNVDGNQMIWNTRIISTWTFIISPKLFLLMDLIPVLWQISCVVIGSLYFSEKF